MIDGKLIDMITKIATDEGKATSKRGLNCTLVQYRNATDGNVAISGRRSASSYAVWQGDGANL